MASILGASHAGILNFSRFGKAPAQRIRMNHALERGCPLRRDGDAAAVMALSLSVSNHRRLMRCRLHCCRFVWPDPFLSSRARILALGSILFPTSK
jgi:hypothetical protein